MTNILHRDQGGQFASSTFVKVKNALFIFVGICLVVFSSVGMYRSNVDAHYVFATPVADDSARLIFPTPIPTATPSPIPTPNPKHVSDYQMAEWVVKYAREYTNTDGQFSIMQAKLQFLLSKESKHNYVSGFGDNGKAGGCLQFHSPTWYGFRRIMFKEGLITETGTRMNCEQAIETTAWAISDGRELNWGPILRGEIEL